MATTFDEIREAALKLPSVSEGTSYGTPCLRVAKSLIARLREDSETLVLKVDPVERDILLEAEPDIFFTTDHYRGYSIVLARLPKADLAHIEMLIRRAWFAVAPKRVTKRFPDGGTPGRDNQKNELIALAKVSVRSISRTGRS
jgi:hypothetical protein